VALAELTVCVVDSVEVVTVLWLRLLHLLWFDNLLLDWLGSGLVVDTADTLALQRLERARLALCSCGCAGFSLDHNLGRPLLLGLLEVLFNQRVCVKTLALGNSVEHRLELLGDQVANQSDVRRLHLFVT